MPRFQSMKLSIPATILAVLLLGGCRHMPDRRLSPTFEAGAVSLTVKVPKELEVTEMRVVYRSTTCTIRGYSLSSGERYERDGYQRMDVKPTQRGQTRLFEAKLPVNGGGPCRWQLSNVTFDVEYVDTSPFGEGIAPGYGAGMVVIFDDNGSPHGSWDFKVDGDLTVVRDYYPWFHESFLGGHRKSISLTTNGHFYLMYKAPHARSIYFEPILHSNFLTRSVGPKVKQSGNRTIFYYPDGSSSFETHTKPNHAKLQAIRMAAEAQQ